MESVTLMLALNWMFVVGMIPSVYAKLDAHKCKCPKCKLWFCHIFFQKLCAAHA